VSVISTTKVMTAQHMVTPESVLQNVVFAMVHRRVNALNVIPMLYGTMLMSVSACHTGLETPAMCKPIVEAVTLSVPDVLAPNLTNVLNA
jgi:hypothetical protein